MVKNKRILLVWKINILKIQKYFRKAQIKFLEWKKIQLNNQVSSIINDHNSRKTFLTINKINLFYFFT